MLQPLAGHGIHAHAYSLAYADAALGLGKSEHKSSVHSGPQSASSCVTKKESRFWGSFVHRESRKERVNSFHHNRHAPIVLIHSHRNRLVPIINFIPIIIGSVIILAT